MTQQTYMFMLHVNIFSCFVLFIIVIKSSVLYLISHPKPWRSLEPDLTRKKVCKKYMIFYYESSILQAGCLVLQHKKGIAQKGVFTNLQLKKTKNCFKRDFAI